MPGSFGVAYKVIDTLGDVSRAMKIVLRDRVSIVDRLKGVQTLLRIPDHPNVVKVIDADFIPGNGPPFHRLRVRRTASTLRDESRAGLFAPEDALELARQVTSSRAPPRRGRLPLRHQARNLLWTERAPRSSTSTSRSSARVGTVVAGHGKYLPPDLDLEAVPSRANSADRDIYALGLPSTRHVTGRYPWDNAQVRRPQARERSRASFRASSDNRARTRRRDAPRLSPETRDRSRRRPI